MPRNAAVLALSLLVACGPFEGDPIGPGNPPPGGGATVAVPFRVGSTNPEESRAIAVTSTGVVVASWFSGTLDFDPRSTSTGRTSLGAQDLAVAKYDFDGAFQWVYSLGGSGAEIPHAIAATPAGGVIVAGYGSGGGICGGRVLTGPGGRDVLLMKLSAGGSCEWAHLIGGPDDDEGRAVAVAADGSVVVAGLFRGTADFNPGGGAALLVSRGSSDAFVARYSPTGEFVGMAQGGGPEDDVFSAVMVAGNGDVTVAGEIRGTTTFGSTLAPAVLVSAGGSDIAMARYTELFGLLWAQRAGGVALDRATAIGADGNGDLLVAGTFEGTADLDPGAGAALVAKMCIQSMCVVCTYWRFTQQIEPICLYFVCTSKSDLEPHVSSPSPILQFPFRPDGEPAAENSRKLRGHLRPPTLRS
jgi:hypothetical protein